MGSIQSSVGLITGIEIEDTVNQLMKIAGTPRDNLQDRTDALTVERTALEQVSSMLLAMHFSATGLTSSSVYNSTSVSSTDTSLLTVAKNGQTPPQAGTYTFTTLQTATTHQAVSSSLSNVESQLSSGSFTIGVGGHVDGGVRLSELNTGTGVVQGSIRITDRSGSSAEIDLRSAISIDDVLDAINSSGDIDITASVSGDSLVLTDNSGGTGNLRVREVGLGTTAASLGLSGINTASDSVTGSDIYNLHSGTLLSSLNDGNGVQIHSVGDALTVTLADDTDIVIDVSGSSTLGEIIDAINEAGGTQLSAAISSDKQAIELTDNSGGSAVSFSVSGTGTLVEDLGLGGTASGNVISGDRILSGLKDTLIRSLNGGQGIAELTSIDITNAAGVTTSGIDLSTAETLSDVVQLINDSGANVTASINSSRNGIQITDNSSGSNNLVISSADTTAANLGIAVDDAVSTINSGSLNRQVVSESTLLTDFNGGKGVRLGDFRVTDSAGNVGAVSLDNSNAEAETIGDVIDAINAMSIDVEARINDTGDGILITDLAGGTGTLTITDISGSNAAADLRIASASSDTNGSSQQIIDGRTSLSIDLSELEVPEGISLSSLNDGNGITLGVMEVTASNGESFFVQLNQPGNEAFSVQDVIDKINDAATAKGVDVVASFNSAGTGLRLLDSEGGAETLTVRDVGTGTAAAELKLTNEASTKADGSQQSINASGLFTATETEQNALDALVEKINAFDGGFTASSFFDGTGYRLSITSEKTGADQELLIDSSLVDFSMQDATRPKDAVLQYGNAATGGIVVTSSNNKFDNVVQGLTVTVVKASSSPVTVEVGSDSSKMVSAVENFVDSFNSLRTVMAELTSFDAEAETTGILFGRSEMLRIETDMSRVLTNAFRSSNQFRTLESVGISMNEDGELELDTAKLTEAFEESPSELEQFFTLDKTGVVDQVQAAIDQLAGGDNALIARRYDALTATIETNEAKIESMTELLDLERTRTLNEFYALEETIAGLQSNLSLLDSIQFIQPISRNNN
ncbi:flagellar filament capping protein FliD [Aeoliella mucimassa]|uniref:Filament cap protein n=1 Tax=Aeoliella mucimassa TaxID=2527972 RepID=A0A518ASC4_9BACT|nr:flagellar filament capping protein FliD [Aeoliella mucimassa]QDU57628.1 Flagellar hook-associated protein 2 [Aeoliella mucimassa]